MSGVVGNYSGTARNAFLATSALGQGREGGFGGRSPYIVFGGGGTEGQRDLTLSAFDLRNKKSLSFDLIAGSDLNGGDRPDSTEPMAVEYSIDGGKTFRSLKNYANTGFKFKSWSKQTIDLPPEAQTRSTILRFNQTASSGPQYDLWGVSGIVLNNKDVESVEPDTRAFTRAGNFQIDKEGYVVTPNGMKLLGTELETKLELAPVRISFENNGNQLSGIDISSTGILSANYGSGDSLKLYQISLAVFKNKSALRPLGSNNFGTSGESGNPSYVRPGSEAGTLMAGALEGSNVDVTGELLKTIAAQQIYNGSARMLQAYVEMSSKLADRI